MKRLIEKIIPVVGTLSLLGMISNFLLGIWTEEVWFTKMAVTCAAIFLICLYVDKYLEEKNQ